MVRDNVFRQFLMTKMCTMVRKMEDTMYYKKAGVDIEAGYKSVELMKEHVKKTMREEVL